MERRRLNPVFELERGGAGRQGGNLENREDVLEPRKPFYHFGF
jgi:hypothetical protein